jgi:hypothetical protein
MDVCFSNACNRRMLLDCSREMPVADNKCGGEKQDTPDSYVSFNVTIVC